MQSKDILNCNNDIFGEWITKHISLNCIPFKHCIIDNFLKEEEYQSVLLKYPQTPNSYFWEYNNPIEIKYTLDRLDYTDDVIKNLFYALSHDRIMSKLSKLFNIPDLEYDPYLHGGGLHMYPKNGRLNLHLDYENHPYLNKRRRLNIIYYVNDTWDKKWNGDIQLWDKQVKNNIVKVYPTKNRAVIFETTDDSWHGVPETIDCPNGVYRKSIAFYYLSNTNNKINGRKKAVFTKRPQDPYDDRMERLYQIRANRRITQNDLDQIYPSWNLSKIK